MSLLDATWGESSDEFPLEKELHKSRLQASLFGLDTRVQLGSFEVLRCIGRGALGVVYEAREGGGEGRVALKLLSRVDGHTIAMLKHEFRVLAGITHPNLVALHELRCEDGRWFVSMELVDGMPFDRWLRDAESGLDEARLRCVLAQLTEAVSVIHRAGKLHRDLKPSNVLITPEGRVVVLDFGLVTAQATGDQQVLGPATYGGTPAYVAPEQAAGQRASVASDWYAVGVMLFEALAGRLPFQGSSQDVLADKQMRDAPSLRSLGARVGPELESLCGALLRRDPSERADAESIQAWLETSSEPMRGPARIDRAPRDRLLGRDSELARLSELLSAVRPAAGTSVLVSGLPGIGKTALLDHFLSTVAANTVVLRGRCYEQESVPYKVFDAVVDALSETLCKLPHGEAALLVPEHISALVRLFPVLQRVPAVVAAAEQHTPAEVDERETRVRAFGALKQLLGRLASRSVLIVAIDDLQWGDVDSAQTIAQVLGPPAAPGLLFLGTFRCDEATTSAFLAHALTKQELGMAWTPCIVELQPLTLEDSTALAFEQLSTHGLVRTADLARQLALESRGIPFFLTELVQHLYHPREPSAGLTSTSNDIASLSRMINDRVTMLSAAAQRLLEVLSAAGRPLEIPVALHAAGLSSDDRIAVTALSWAHLARRLGARPTAALETYHDQVREAVSATLAPGALRNIHVRLARALHEHGICDPERLLLHYMAAGETQLAAENALPAAQAAMHKLAFNRAAELYQHAIDLHGDEAARDKQLYRQLGDALAQAGRGASAADAYLRAAPNAATGGARELRCLAARQYLRSGRVDEGLELAGRVLEDVGVHMRRASLLGLLWQRMRLRLVGFEAKSPPSKRSSTSVEALETMGNLFPELLHINGLRAAQLHARFLRTAIKLGDSELILHGLVWEVYISALSQGKRAAGHTQRIVEVARKLTARTNTPYAQAMLHMARSAQLFLIQERSAEAYEAAVLAEDLLGRECPGTAWEREMALFLRLSCLEMLGDMQMLQKLVVERLRDGHERDDRFMLQILLLSAPASYLRSDEPLAAAAFLEHYKDKLGPNYSTFKYVWLLRSVELLMYMGRATEGVALMQSHWPHFRRSLLYASPFVRSGFSLLASRCLLGAYMQTRDRAYRRRAEPLLRKWGREQTLYGACQRGLRGVLYAADGSMHAAILALDEAISDLESKSPVVALIFRRKRYQVAADSLGLARIDDKLRAAGVVNPAHLVKVTCGG